ncbi:hypothetical protein [Actinophytocola gossypii]|uniref:Uncharacterized protein n=1 Tax=Actinophytocola gossypii TaxID=2812003 RepID=A0ABT2J3U0_9PSEU|nr:hypothetical protein [Actinophytocola gossypii]MCT2582421.1 hypothetical protein [Actinophytocola gossypii]
MHADQQERKDTATGHEPRHGRHSAPEGADLHPLIDLGRDPNPGVANHAKPDED